VWVLKPSPTQRVERLTANLTGATPLTTGSPFPDVSISPDGGWIVYVVGAGGGGQGRAHLMLRPIDQLEAAPVPGPTGTGAPFFSPDGRWIGFGADGELRKVPLTGGPPVSICRVDGVPRGASWGSDNTIVFSTNGPERGLERVSADGGEPTRLTTPDASQGELRHVLPVMLPGSRAVLFTVTFTSGPNDALVAALDLVNGQRKTLIRGGSQPQFIEPGYLVYQAAGSLMAVRFDADRLEVLGQPVRIVEGILVKPNNAGEFAVSREGTLTYVPSEGTPAPGAASFTAPARSIMWVDRHGQEEPIGAPLRPYVYARLSPDERRVALDIRDQDRDIWVWDLARRTLSRLTSDPALETSPVWTPDSLRIVFGSQRAGASNLYWQLADGIGTAERLTAGLNNQVPTAVSPDGHQILYYETGPKTDLDLMMLHLDGQRRSDAVLTTSFTETNGDISPDGRWLAYESNESGEVHVYVRPFPKTEGGRFQVSTSGGRLPRWAHSGRELFYLNKRNELMAAPVETVATFKAGIPSKVLDAKYFAGGSGAGARTYDVSHDGQRFLMIKGSGDSADDEGPRQMVVVLNWREELKARVGTN